MYGPVGTVVWQGSVGNHRPYADLVGLPEKWRVEPASAATFGIYVGKMRLFPWGGELIFSGHGTVLAGKAKRDARRRRWGVCCLWDEKAKIGIISHESDHA